MKLGKPRILVHLNPEVEHRLRIFINKKYPAYSRGYLSEVVEQSLIDYFEKYTHIFTQNDSENVIYTQEQNKAEIHWEKVKNEIIKQEGFIPDEIPKRDLINAMVKLWIDSRVHRDKIKLFQNEGIIQSLNGKVFKILKK